MLTAKTIGLALAGVTLAGVAFAAAPAHAGAGFAPVTVSGLFTTDDQHALYNFSLTTPQTLYFYTTSYAGGKNVDGSVTSSGGFDPVLGLYDSTGTLLIENDDDVTHFNHPDPETGNVFDSFISQTLNPGSYTLAVTEYDNFSNGTLASGFSEDGNGNFTGALFGNPDGSDAGKPFFDYTGQFSTPAVAGDQNDGHYTFNIATLAPAVPEATTVVSLGMMLALGGLVLTGRKRKASAK